MHMIIHSTYSKQAKGNNSENDAEVSFQILTVEIFLRIYKKANANNLDVDCSEHRKEGCLFQV